MGRAPIVWVPSRSLSVFFFRSFVMQFEPVIHAGGHSFGLMSDDRGALDSIVIQAGKDLNELISTVCPPLPRFDRSAEKEAADAVASCQVAVTSCRANKIRCASSQ